jgi:hypothetical protein
MDCVCVFQCIQGGQSPDVCGPQCGDPPVWGELTACAQGACVMECPGL